MEGGVRLSIRRQTPPVAASTFVRDTVALIQKSQQSGIQGDKAELALRTPMMRQLSSIVQNRKISPDQSLQRSAQLSQQLIEAGYIEDEPLRLPNQWFGRAQRLAQALGLRVDPIAQATRALVSSSQIWITGVDAHTRALFARGLCEEIFQAFPYEPIHSSESSKQRLTESLSELSRLSWDRDPQEGQELRRQMMIGLHSESDTWRRYRRAFAVLNQAHSLNADQRESASLSLSSHHLINDLDLDHPRIERLPREGRVIYLSEYKPQDHRGEVVISLEVETEQLKHIWHRDLRARLTAQEQEPASIEERLSNPLTQAFTSLLGLALELRVLTPHQAFDALLYSVLTGADLAIFTDAAELYIYPHLKDDELKRDCLLAFAQCDQDGYEASWVALYPERVPPEIPSSKLDI